MDGDRAARTARGATPSAFTITKSSEAQSRKDPEGFESMATVLKLTQVGEASSLRRSGERWLRNSAN